MSTLPDANGTRDHLTPSQTRILYKLWQRFFRLCETPSGSAVSGGGGGGGSTPPTAQVGLTSAAASVPGSREGAAPSPSSSSGGKLAGSSSPPAPMPSTSAAAVAGTATSHTNSHPILERSTSSQPSSYGKPIQRLPSRSRQIDDRRGSRIPKDDRVQDELQTIEEAKEMREFLEKYGGEKLRTIFWDMVKGEHPDAIMLRFLRARKWDIDRTVAVIGSTAAFRAENNVKELVQGGELLLTRTKGGMKLMDNGTSYVYGATAMGEPVYFIEVGSHFSHNQTQEELKHGVILLQEWLQMLMPPPIERKIVVFNMNQFGIRNMDWWCVFFLVKTMGSYYVETLTKVYVHGAPWIFRPIWAILKPLLDPVVRDKIRLTFSAEELAEHIPFDHLPKVSMCGGMNWQFSYPLPDPHENDQQLDTETRDRLARDFDQVSKQFDAATRQICHLYARNSLIQRGRDGSHHDVSSDSDPDDEEVTVAATGRSGAGMGDDVGADLKAKRDVLATRLRVAFLRLRPYIVGKSKYDRWNVFRPDGSIVWEYLKADGTTEEQVLGQGTTLPALERNLEMIDSAQNISATQSRYSLQDALDEADGSVSVQAKESNRQKRLRNRTREYEQQQQATLPSSLPVEGTSSTSTTTVLPTSNGAATSKEETHSPLANDSPPVHPLHST